MSNTKILPDMGYRVQFHPDDNIVAGVRTLRDSGGSTVLTIPPEILDVLEWDDGDDLRLEADYEDGNITVELSE